LISRSRAPAFSGGQEPSRRHHRIEREVPVGGGHRCDPGKPDAARIPLQRPGRLHQRVGEFPTLSSPHTGACGTRQVSPESTSEPGNVQGHCFRSPTFRSVTAHTPSSAETERGCPTVTKDRGNGREGVPFRGHGVRTGFPMAGSADPRPVTRSRRIVVWIYLTKLSRTRFKPGLNSSTHWVSPGSGPPPRGAFPLVCQHRSGVYPDRNGLSIVFFRPVFGGKR
jgi:hypothetical protein